MIQITPQILQNLKNEWDSKGALPRLVALKHINTICPMRPNDLVLNSFGTGVKSPDDLAALVTPTWQLCCKEVSGDVGQETKVVGGEIVYVALFGTQGNVLDFVEGPIDAKDFRKKLGEKFGASFNPAFAAVVFTRYDNAGVIQFVGTSPEYERAQLIREFSGL